MAGTSKNYAPTQVQIGPGDVWIIGTAPTDTAIRLTLASNGTPDATAHPGSVHLGMLPGATTLNVKPKLAAMSADQFEISVDSLLTELEGKIETEISQLTSVLLSQLLGIGVYSTGTNANPTAGTNYAQLTFGGNFTVPKACVAIISPSRINSAYFNVVVLYLAYSAGGMKFSLGKTKAASVKATFAGLTDLTRTAGRMVGVIYSTLAATVGGTPTAKNSNVLQIQQGPADLWIIDTYAADALATAPTDTTASGATLAQQVALDAATLTPLAAAHPNAANLGITQGAVEFEVVPKFAEVKADQADGGVDVYLQSASVSMSAELGQGSMTNLAAALGVGTYSLSAGVYAQLTIGGTFQPGAVCVAAIAPKRTAPTKAVVACLYRVHPTEGFTVTVSRTKESTVKVKFDGHTDVNRTAGRTVGIYHEMM
jgi:hypothetical protein